MTRWPRVPSDCSRGAAVVLLGLLLVAAVTRLPGLDVRGRWDADQGHDMLVLRALVARGESRSWDR